MKKNLFLFLVFICFTNILCAKNRTTSQATQLAGDFMTQSVSTMKKAPSVSSSTLTLAFSSYRQKVTPVENEAYYYVFNKGNENGYIIISGDDRAKTILGYTDNGHFDITALPDNLKYWLSFYENEIKSLPDSSLQTTISATNTLSQVKSNTASTLSAVAPLLGTIQWNQEAPYNNQCPVINSSTGELAVTGCVATGMAQVMKYYSWPVQGTGSNSYTSTTLKIAQSVDFSKTTYDWKNMTNTYSSSSSLLQDTAVSTLMHHCGVAVNMDYGESSSASTQNMALALKNNFGYDSNLQLYSRDYYTRAEWTSFLTAELNATRPVLYSGQSDSGGHLFVCDGYDSNGLFHFNWGWGGMSNGYFEISALDSNNPGISTSTVGFNSTQTIVTGLQKPGSSTTPVYLIYTTKALTSSATSVTRSASFTATSNSTYNFGVNVFSGSIGLGLYNDNGLVSVINSGNVSSLAVNYGWSALNMSASIPSAIANGNYKLYYVYKATTDANWQIVRGKVGNANYLNIVVGTSTVTISSPAASGAVLNLNSFTVTGNLYQNESGRFNINVTNTGIEYNSKIGINIQSTSNSTVYQLLTPETVNIAAGETRSLDFTGIITVAPGAYTVTAVYDPLNYYSSSTVFSQLGSALTQNVLTTPTAAPVLTLSNVISFPNSATVDKNNAVLSAKIKNTGGFFDNKIIAFIFPTAGGSSLTYIGYQEAIFDTNEERTVTFEGPIVLTPGQYQIATYYMNSSSAWSSFTPSGNYKIPFTLVDNVATTLTLNSISGIQVYPNPVVDYLHLKTDVYLKRIIIADLLGKQIKSIVPENKNDISLSVVGLNSGVYLIRCETENGIMTSKFIKK
jgi:hypothetical protein